MGRPFPKSAAALDTARAALIHDIVAKVAKIGTGDGGKTLQTRVLDAIKAVPREKFVPMMEQADAYANRPLPIGHRQTISQPLIVALMTHHLDLKADSKVLEIGTGSGYQTTILAELAGRVVTIENVAPLAETAKAALDALGYHNIDFIQRDGRKGSPEDAPFDRIMVTAAAEAVPKDLIEQLGPDGRLVAPIGGSSDQRLVLMTKDTGGRIKSRPLFPVAFVPLTYGHDQDA